VDGNNKWSTPTDAGTRTVRIEAFGDDPDTMSFAPWPLAPTARLIPSATA
jgi:hypothetical protein